MPLAGGSWVFPRPGIRSSSPSTTSASIACRTVIRATPNRCTSSRSDGAGVPGAPPETNARTYSRTWTCFSARPSESIKSSTSEL